MSQFIEMVGDPRNNPKGWPTKRLSELAEYSIGLTYKPEQICDVPLCLGLVTYKMGKYPFQILSGLMRQSKKASS